MKSPPTSRQTYRTYTELVIIRKLYIGQKDVLQLLYMITERN